MATANITAFDMYDVEEWLFIEFSPCTSEYRYKLRISLLGNPGTSMEDKLVKVLQTYDNVSTGDGYFLDSDVVQYLYSYASSMTFVTLTAVIEIWDRKGTTKLGESYQFFARPSFNNASPVVTGTVVDTNATTIALTGDKNKLIKYFSNAKATMTAEAQKGAAIDENLYIIRNGENSAYTTECTFENVENNVFTFSAEDSRGLIGKDKVEPSMVDYTKLTCSIALNRPDGLGNMTVACSGQYFNDTFGAVANTLTVQYRYAVSGGAFSDWADMDVTKYSTSYYASADFEIPDFNNSQFYSFETRAIDKLMTVSSSASGIKSTPIFHWGENDFAFEVPVSFNAGVGDIGDVNLGNTNVGGDLNVTGDLRLKGSGNYGNTLRFGDKDYCYLKEETDDVLTIKAKRLNLEGTNGVRVNGCVIPYVQNNSWTPSLQSGVVSSYTTQKGTYSIVWNTANESTISVGFYIKAKCNSGYQNTDIVIQGFPIAPNFAVAGGGMCSGAYVSAGFNFQCFVLETSGEITMRVQACNNTAASNLATSASGCRYPSGGGEITLSGTITFLVIS